MTREEAVALLERYSNYEGLGIPNLAGCKEAMKVAAEALKEAYPELAESEDERIRRWLCDYFSSIDKAWIHKDITCIDILRWLEKQKEQKHPNGCFTCDEYKKGYEEGRRNGFTAGYNKAMKEVEQKEQKPVDNPKWAELTWKDINELERIINNVHYEFQNGIGEDSFGELVLERFREYKDDGSMDEQKPTDLSDMMVHKEPYIAPVPTPMVTDEQKQEWSEEDEEMLNSCISSIEESKENRYAYKETDGDTSYDREVDWLKSLRPSWKPSEEQMKALYDACCIAFEEERDFHPSLSRLYHDLRKL